MNQDVVIVGARPTGLMLACALGLAGVRATVLEKLPSPTGLSKALGLQPKLAAAIHGWAPPGLLDTYNSERQPVGKRVLMATRAATALAKPGGHVSALRELMSELLKRDQVLRTIIEMLASVDVHYVMDARGGDARPLLGHWAPNLPLATATGETRLPRLMHGGRAVLLDLADRTALRDTAAGWKDRVDVVPARCEGQSAPADVLLIRPDGYIAYVASAQDADNQAERRLCEALTTWFGSSAEGPPVRVPAPDTLRAPMRVRVRETRSETIQNPNLPNFTLMAPDVTAWAGTKPGSRDRQEKEGRTNRSSQTRGGRP